MSQIFSSYDEPLEEVEGFSAEQVIVNCNKFAMESLHSRDTEKALSLLNRAQSLVQQLDNDQLQAITLNNLGCLYKRTGNFTKALHLFSSALECEYRNPEDFMKIAGTYLNLCAVKSQLGVHDEALEDADQAIELLKKEGADLSSRVIAYYYAGMESEFLGFNDKAENYFRKGWKRGIEYLGRKHEVTQKLKNAFNKYQRYSKSEVKTVKKRKNSFRGKSISNQYPRLASYRRDSNLSSVKKPKKNASSRLSFDYHHNSNKSKAVDEWASKLRMNTFYEQQISKLKSNFVNLPKIAESRASKPFRRNVKSYSYNSPKVSRNFTKVQKMPSIATYGDKSCPRCIRKLHRVTPDVYASKCQIHSKSPVVFDSKIHSMTKEITHLKNQMEKFGKKCEALKNSPESSQWKEKAIKLIQKIYRGWKVRKKISQESKAARVIQKLYRTWKKNSKNTQKAALTIQRHFRGWKERKNFLSKTERQFGFGKEDFCQQFDGSPDVKTETPQSSHRSIKSYIFNTSRNTPIFIARSIKQGLLHYHIVKAQALIRGFLTRNRVKKLDYRITKIQALWKMYSTRRIYLSIKNAVVFIQKAYKQYENRKKSRILIFEDMSVFKSTKAWRG